MTSLGHVIEHAGRARRAASAGAEVTFVGVCGTDLGEPVLEALMTPDYFGLGRRVQLRLAKDDAALEKEVEVGGGCRP